MKTVLVTGGAGFIGSNFIYLLLAERKEYRVVCVDALTYAANPHTLEQAHKNSRFCFYRENICNREGIFSIFKREKPDVVVNFAAESHVDRSIVNPGIFLETNILGTQVLMDACREYGAERFHQVSTDEVYGDLPLGDRSLLFTETSPLRPSSPYAASKTSADLLALAYHKTFGLPVTVSRCSNNYGPYQFPEKLIPLMISNALHDLPLPVYGDGKNVRDWLYVKDHCCGILAVLEKGKAGEVYNLGGHNERSNVEIVRKILCSLGKSENLMTFVEDRKGHDRRYAIDPTKADVELGWHPGTEFEDGLEKTLRWYLENGTWLSQCFEK